MGVIELSRIEVDTAWKDCHKKCSLFEIKVNRVYGDNEILYQSYSCVNKDTCTRLVKHLHKILEE